MVEKLEHHNKSSKENEQETKIDYDTILTAAGEFGLFQWLMLLASCPFYIFGAFTYFGQIFMTESSSNHWCWIPELQNLTETERRTLAIPIDHNSRWGYSQCQSYKANWTEVFVTGTRPNSTWPVTSCQYGWEFNKTEIPYPTISSEMGWVCDKNSYQATAQSIFFVGSIAGGFLIGWIADKYGRIPAATCSNVIGCVAGIASAYVSNFVQFAVCRFFVGMAYDNCMMMTYLLILEYSTPKYRTIATNLPFAVSFTVALSALPWIALACGHWKTFTISTSVPLALSLLAPFLLPESPRWLLSKGRVNEAITKLGKISRVNKKEIPPKLMDHFKLFSEQKIETENASVLKLLQSPLLRKLFICICIEYMSLMIVFDVSTRTLDELEYDFFLTFTLVSLTELPSLLIVSFVLDLTGRRWLTIVVMTICALSSLLTAFVGKGLAPVVCAMVTRFTVNMASNTAMQWGAELLPTPVRGSGANIIHICGYIGTVISPFIAYLEVVTYWLPFVIVGCGGVLCAVLAFMLPETARKEMPQTFEAAEDLMRNKTFWDLPARSVSSAKREVAGHVNEALEMN
jgi:MFS transporter, OCT family, solute carrier family 22 (organic cation transporter), member 13